MKENEYMVPDRSLPEILAEMLKDKTDVVCGVPTDYLGREMVEEWRDRLGITVVVADVMGDKNKWVLGRIASDLEESPNNIIVSYLNNLQSDYCRNGNVKTPVQECELIYSFFSNPDFSSRAIEITIAIYRKRYPKLWERVEEMIRTAKSDDSDKADRIYKQLAAMYLSKEASTTTGMICAAFFSVVQTCEEEFTLPSLCMLDICSTSGQPEDTPSPLKKVIMRLTCGSSDPYSLQKAPGAGLKSYNYAEAVLGTPEIGESWIVKKYLKKRREALYQALGVTSETFAEKIEKESVPGFNKEIQNMLCEYFHIPNAQLHNAFDRLADRRQEITKDLFSDPFVDCYYIIKLRVILDAMSEEELEAVTTRDIVGHIGMDSIESDAAFFQNFYLIVALFLLANQYRQDYYALYDFSDQQAEYHSIGQSYQQELAECREEIRKKDEIIARYKAQEAKREIRKSNKSEKPLLAEISSLKNIITKKDNEIASLKEQLEEETEFCSILEKDMEEQPAKKDRECDLSVLKGKRFAFVCNEVDATLPDLRKMFPDSVFIEKDTVQGRAKNVDLVVIATRHISHSIYFKVKKMYRDVPTFLYNRKSLDELKLELAEYFSN